MAILAHTTLKPVLVWTYAGVAVLFLFLLNFFRDPHRKLPEDEQAIVAPADGKIVKIETVNDPDVGENATSISIFLTVFNVHANRVPMDGTVTKIQYRTGRFRAAFDHRASDENERKTTVFDTVQGPVKVTQIAGLIARRIICYARKDMRMKRGKRLGFITFGSRTDIVLPSAVKISVQTGQKVRGSETIIGLRS